MRLTISLAYPSIFQRLPVDLLIADARAKAKWMQPPGQPFTLEAFPFVHAVCMLGHDVHLTGDGVAVCKYSLPTLCVLTFRSF